MLNGSKIQCLEQVKNRNFRLISGDHLGGLVSYYTGCAYLPVADFVSSVNLDTGFTVGRIKSQLCSI